MSASPQTEDGYTRIAHELMEALIKAPIGGRALALCLLVLRESYGWSKKETGPMGMKLIARRLGCQKSSAQSAIREATESRIIIRTAHESGASIWAINKDYTQWGDATASPGGRPGVPLGDATASRGGRYSVRKSAHYKVLKETLKKRKKTTGPKKPELSTIVNNLGITPKLASEILAVKFPFGKAWKGQEIGAIPAKDCTWILNKWPHLSANLKQALELNVKLAEFETKRRAKR